MKGLLVLLAVAVAITAMPQGAKAGTVLADWCVNVNGDINTACNGASSGGASGSSTIDLSGFDTTLSPAVNALGTISVTIASGAQNIAVYMDYDLNFAASGSFSDYGTVQGGAPAGVTYEMDDPNSSNIFSDFSSSLLISQNNVGTPGGPPNECCDVSWALNLSTNLSTGATVAFTVNATKPTSGFYLQQTNSVDGDSIYLSETVTPIGGTNPPGVPEPATLALLAGGLVGVLALRKRTAA